MSDYRITNSSNRILPGGMENELQRLPLRFAGVALIGITVIGWISLITWTISDPSLNRASPGAAHNLLGAGGASMSDMLMQMVGLGSVVLFLPPAFWGYQMARGEYVDRPRHRLAMWGAAMVLLASTLSMMAKPQGWYLPHGLGGVIGDFGQNFFLRVGGFMEPRLANVIGGVISGYFGAWTLMRACTLTLADLRMLFEFGDSGNAKGKAKTESTGWLAGSIASASDWMRGVRHQILAQADGEKEPAKSGPREYWITEDPDRFAPSPPSRPRRHGEGSYDTRLNYDVDDDELEPLPRIRRRVPLQDAPKPAPKVELDDGRIEPYFGSSSGGVNTDIPVEDPKVTVVPFQAQPRAQTVPAKQPAAAPQSQSPQPQPQPQPVRQTPACLARSDEHHGSTPARSDEHRGMRQRAPYVEPPPAPPQRPLPEPFGQDDDEDDDDFDGFDDIPFEQPRREEPRPAPAPRVTAPFRPEIRRNGAQAPSQAQRGQGSRIVEAEQAPLEFVLPSLKLLNPAPPRHTNPELSDVALGRRAEMLQGVLEDFGIKGQITGVHPGPVITLYELEPARGTKSSRVIGLADDIARSMSAVSARVAVIPGRDAIGIELPNQNREVVYLRELLASPDFNSGKARLALALGKTIGGDPITVDLARMPHLLIAGTTGSGKSVAINTMIMSLLFRLKPEECRFIMIDPKMLELSVYDGIPHLLTPVVTDPKKAIVALKWTVAEMTSRYERMCKLGVRNIMGFNQKVTRAAQQGRPLSRTVQTGFDEDTGSAIYEREDVDCSPMPYIVVVIDEMADLMMVAGKEIEFTVQRLSQMARAAGIHLIMATQRPSVDVITGTIKANFPSRISFQVASKIDSRTILGEQGAEQLLGAGDMLTMAAGGRIMRAHGPFVSDEEVERIVSYLREQGEPDYLDAVLEDDEPDTPRRGAKDKDKDEPLIRQTGDELYDQAVDVVLRERRATTSYLQRRLGVGYNRAASLIEQMEKEGLISAPNRTGKREILYGEEA